MNGVDKILGVRIHENQIVSCFNLEFVLQIYRHSGHFRIEFLPSDAFAFLTSPIDCTVRELLSLPSNSPL